ncbi:intermediate filament protein [Scheffersomyces xylosifermentans]|uniref:intermediate filament protein n=1 Tax=Scheffersomyces xylosifermentans TaxID=1304137 RepID=UPI00315C9995
MSPRGILANVASRNSVRRAKQVLWFVVYATALSYLLRYTYIYGLVFLVGSLLSFSLVGYCVLFLKIRRPSPSVQRSKRFKFVNSATWTASVNEYSANHSNFRADGPILEESFLISETLEEFIDLTIKEFIDGWFHHVSSNESFQVNIKSEMKSVFSILISRVKGIDLAKLVVSHILPILNDHFACYIKAEEAIRLKGTVPKSESPEYHLAIATHFDKGRIHPGVTVSNVENNDTNEKNYLRSRIGSVLVLLLSEQERSNEIVVSLVTEILACTILTSILQMLGEGDFYNLLIVKLIGDNLKHRDQVKRLREALKEHTEQLSKLSDDPKLLSSYIVTDSTTQTAYARMIKSIHEMNSFERINTIDSMSTLTLTEVLSNPASLKIFSEFMKDAKRLEVLEFWKDIDSLRAPLEDSVLNDDGEVNMSLSLEFSTTDDIRRIYDKFFKSMETYIDHESLEIVSDLLENTTSQGKLLRYQNARKAMFKIQSSLFDEMNSRDFIDFKKSGFVLKLVNIKKFKTNEKVSPDVIQAVEDAFTRIMKSPTETKNEFTPFNNSNMSSSSLPDFSSSEKSSATEVKKDLFGETSSLFGYDPSDVTTSSQGNRYSKLFDDFSDESGTDSDSIIFDSDSQILPSHNLEDMGGSNPEVFLAAPGNLNLAEEIPKLSEEIEKLNEQVEILEPLIRKAELTDNVTELRILTKSKVSLDREINSKELQKQQYIVQENDNSLYGKSRVSIQSYISGNENGKEFILYIIEVQKFSSDDPLAIKAGWVVARRFSQFFKLHEYLKLRYPQVSNIKFPKRTVSVLKFQQRQVVELRKIALEEYLQELIKIPQVCGNKAFRSFLSSENFTLRKNQAFEDGLHIAGDGSKSNVEMVANKLYNGISSRFVPQFNILSNKFQSENNNKEMMENIKDMQQELRQFDEYGTASSKTVFVKPICDLLITVFRLNNSKSWLRGRALVVILQQIFGTTIEKKAYEQVEQQVKTEENMLDILILLKNTIFPNGKFKDSPLIRTLYQRATTRQEAKALLAVFMNETCSRIFGTANTTYASTKIFSMLQNDFLNKHLILQILDELLDEVFPEKALKPRVE